MEPLGKALASIGKPAVPVLVEAMAHSDDRIRVVAMTALADIGTEAHPAAPRLVEALGDPFGHVRQAAAMALTRIGTPASPLLIQFIENADRNTPDHSMELVRKALVEIGPESDPDIGRLLRLLNGTGLRPDHHRSIPKVAGDVLASVGKPAIRGLTAELESDSEQVRRRVLNAFKAMGPEAAEALPEIIVVLQSDSKLRSNALSAIGAIGSDQHGATDAVIQLYKNENASRADCLFALARLAPRSPKALSFISERIKDGPEVERMFAVRVLSADRSAAKQFLPILLDAAQRDRTVRSLVLRLLNDIGFDRTAVPVLVTALEDTEGRVDLALVYRGIETLGSQAKATVPALTKRLDNASNDRDIDQIMSALAAIGSDASAAADSMAKAIQRSENGEDLRKYLRKVIPPAQAEEPLVVPSEFEF